MRLRLFRSLAMALLVGGALMSTSAPASAGGGCHSPRTRGEGTTVALSQLCMTPTVLNTGVGATVTFVNEDALPHNVVGHGFYADLQRQSDSVQYRFDEAGIYPFACTLHLGMTGAVVVGDGAGGGGRVIEVAAVSPTTRQPALIADPSEAPANAVPVPLALGGALALAVVGLVVGRVSSASKFPLGRS